MEMLEEFDGYIDQCEAKLMFDSLPLIQTVAILNDYITGESDSQLLMAS